MRRVGYRFNKFPLSIPNLNRSFKKKKISLPMKDPISHPKLNSNRTNCNKFEFHVNLWSFIPKS